MNGADKYLLKNGYNLDGSKMSKTRLKNCFKVDKRQLKTELFIADKKTIQKIKYRYDDLLTK